jgi:hypothetical protein
LIPVAYQLRRHVVLAAVLEHAAKKGNVQQILKPVDAVW